MYKKYCFRCEQQKEVHEFSNKGIVTDHQSGKTKHICDKCCVKRPSIRRDLDAYKHMKYGRQDYFRAKGAK